MNARNAARMAAAFAAVEAENVAAGRQDDPHARQLAEWARRHRTQIETRLGSAERDPLTLDLFAQEA